MGLFSTYSEVIFSNSSMKHSFSFTSILLLLCWVLFLLFLMAVVHYFVPYLFYFSLCFAPLTCVHSFFYVMVFLELKSSSRPIASELGVALLLHGEGVDLVGFFSPVKSCLATQPFGDGDRGFGDAFILLVSFPTLGMICSFSFAIGLFNPSRKSFFPSGSFLEFISHQSFG